ncbi:hypothetical protein ES708_23408 [subsurface metagenome]
MSAGFSFFVSAGFSFFIGKSCEILTGDLVSFVDSIAFSSSTSISLSSLGCSVIPADTLSSISVSDFVWLVISRSSVTGSILAFFKRIKES